MIGLVVLSVLAATVIGFVGGDGAGYRTEERMLRVNAADPVELDTTLYVPGTATPSNPAPAVLLSHGFGGTKASVAAAAEELAEHGYVVLTWTARGFGRSGGRIHLNSPEHEVADAADLLDWVASRPEVLSDGRGDPRVGVVGASYGGALALLLAGYDDRVDALVPQMTWHDLAAVFLPEATGAGPANGVFKRAWAGVFFGAVTGIGAEQGRLGGVSADPECGRFAAEICRAYQEVAATGRASEQVITLLRQRSPVSVVDRITAPTLVVQGTADTLFPLSEADAIVQGLARAGTPVAVTWASGGHDGGEGADTDTERIRRLSLRWLDRYLWGVDDQAEEALAAFTYSRVTGFDLNEGELTTATFQASAYPGLDGEGTPHRVTVEGEPVQIASPPGGTPAALSSLPGAGPEVTSGLVVDIPGQYARYLSAPLETALDVTGAPTVDIRVASPTGEAVLFVKLYDVGPDGRSTLPNGQVAPVRLTGLPSEITEAEPVTVTLPALAYRFEAGHRLGVVIATSDQAYAGPDDPRLYTVALGAGDAAEVTLPQVPATVVAGSERVLWAVLVGLVVALAGLVGVASGVARIRRRRVSRVGFPDYREVPLVVRGLRKVYTDGFVAVDDLTFTVQPGRVVGLLGPNGAGKTTTLRMLLGLIRPTAGEILVFGHPLTPGAPVLSRIGALVEGPGFLPHLSGLDNLRLYWQATGRPISQARLDEVLHIAGLGEAVHRKVRTYSHGMRQRLAIAQAMLGMPQLLILDEPTDGLDPPQIAQMRQVLRRYATDGRAVLVSSHLLAEVEQTCTDVVVMHRGTLVAAGPVAEIVGDSRTVLFGVSDVEAAERVLRELPGVRPVARDAGGLIVDIDGASRGEVVAALVTSGIAVERVVPRQRLEDAFLALVADGEERRP